MTIGIWEFFTTEFFAGGVAGVISYLLVTKFFMKKELHSLSHSKTNSKENHTNEK